MNCLLDDDLETVKGAAEMLDCALKLRKMVGRQADWEEPIKMVSLICRELFLLEICCNLHLDVAMSGIAFECAWHAVAVEEYGPNIRSQLRLARSTITRLGVDKHHFDHLCGRMYGNAFND